MYDIDGHLHPAAGLSESARGRRERQDQALHATKHRLSADIHPATKRSQELVFKQDTVKRF